LYTKEGKFSRPLSPIAEKNKDKSSFSAYSHVHQSTLAQQAQKKLPLNFVQQYNIKLQVKNLCGLDHLQIIF